MMKHLHRLIAISLFCVVRSNIAADAPPGDKPFTQIVPDTDITFEMAPIPAGKFFIGSPANERDRKADEGPQFEVRMEKFWMGRHVVTWPQYKAFLENYDRLCHHHPEELPRDKWADAVTYPTPIYELETGPLLDRMGRGTGFPAVSMSQFSARQYTKWLSGKTGRFYRLPTEAEWEYACRAGTTTAFNFGNDSAALRDHGWFIDNSELKDTDPAYHKVGQKPPNAWGLFDMHGNVAQWCVDQYDPLWYAKFAGKSVDWHDCINWPGHRYPVVLRGGGYESDAEDCRSATRLHSTRQFNDKDANLPPSAHWETTFWIGFRIVAPAREPDESEKTKFWYSPDKAMNMALEEDRQKREIVAPGGKGRE